MKWHPDCPVCDELRKQHLPLTSHVKPFIETEKDVYSSPDAQGYIAPGEERHTKRTPTDE